MHGRAHPTHPMQRARGLHSRTRGEAAVREASILVAKLLRGDNKALELSRHVGVVLDRHLELGDGAVTADGGGLQGAIRRAEEELHGGGGLVDTDEGDNQVWGGDWTQMNYEDDRCKSLKA